MSSNIESSLKFDDPQFADLLIHCGRPGDRKSVHCHRVIVCPKSRLLEKACAAAPEDAFAGGKKFEITVDTYYDDRERPLASKGVCEVLKFLYQPESTTDRWLREHWARRRGLVDLLSILDVTWTLAMPDLRNTVRCFISQKLLQMHGPDVIARTIAVGADVKNTPSLEGFFVCETQQLLLKDKFLKKQETMMLLRDPEQRSKVSEREYQLFLHEMWCNYRSDHEIKIGDRKSSEDAAAWHERLAAHDADVLREPEWTGTRMRDSDFD
ncbi:unnamed protein product [Zymoseptoria tritici ST99CH_1A5]|uniref:BTB domain-containing protein n=1 Tax=Zymoseptoria tritici ST99CH_1A5 TaxID=1276529 RepID=A0A1Y6LVX5_ZYMTR|nr:unnamed protein product [Zymoseptoria tritici ST99CH_1A5]